VSLIRRRSLVAASLALGAALEAPRVHAEEAPKSVTHEYSPYEKETITNALASTGRTQELDPEGKEIEAIDVVPLEVFEKRDPLPQWLNVFHWTSKPYTIDRELLTGVGEKYSKVVVDESARNLRNLAAQISIVLIVATKGNSPGKVRLLVITKDVWSLRLNSNYRFANGRLENLYLEPSEQNAFGTHQIASVQYFMQPLSHLLGAYYKIPWLAGTRVQVIANAAVILSREHGGPEGSYLALTVQYPLFSSRTPWSWKVAGDHRNEVTRLYQNGLLGLFDSKRTPDKDGIPFEYRSKLATAIAAVTRSFGWARKTDVSFGMQLDGRKYATYDLSPYAPAAADDFLGQVPVSDTRVGPFVQLRTYRSDFLRTLDVEILGLQEDFRLGADLGAKVYASAKPIGSTRDFLGLDVVAQYTQRLHDGFVRVSAEGIVEAQTDTVSDASLDARLRVVTPRLGFGRLVLDLGTLQRFRNYLNLNTKFGGETRPRGYPTNYFRAPNNVVGSLEWRSPSVDILKTLWGVVAFVDVGTAYRTEAGVEPRYGTGLGLRVLLPQFDRLVVRGDVAVPIDRHRPSDVPPVQFLITVGQAFSVPNVAL